MIDLDKYAGHMLNGARDGGPTEYRNQRAIAPSIGVLYGAGPSLDATVALVIDAPKLLDEVKRLRWLLEQYGHDPDLRFAVEGW